MEYEIGFHLRPEFWGRGYAAEAAAAVIRYAFKELKAEKLFAGHNPSNAASRKVLGKLGFAYIGDEFYPPTGLQHPPYLYTREVFMMNQFTIRMIDVSCKADINIPNEPFKLYGRMLPAYQNGQWSYAVEQFDNSQIRDDRFPDENYDYDELAREHLFVGAYDGDKCIGLAILRHSWFKYMYLYDLKVNADYRGQHVGARLIEKSKSVALEHGYNGLYTQGQDNNLGACLFYLHNGFVIGGLNTHVYKGTVQENKSDIYFYCDVK